MMDTTARLSLPLLVSQQASKHITHNEALAGLDVLVQPVVVSRSVSEPPAVPIAGEAWIVGAAAEAGWAGHDDEIAVCQAGGWVFHDPAEGWQAFVTSSAEWVVFQDGGWVVLAGNGPTGVPRIGINGVADTTNRLTVSAPASLFNHDGGPHQIKINKATGADTASLNFLGHAEMGLTGDTDWHLKVSDDGLGWTEALHVGASGGVVRIGAGLEPASDGAVSLGASGARWSAVWSATGTIQTSDARDKADIAPSELGLDFVLALEPVRYRFLGGSRPHHGLIAQQVKAVMDLQGIADFAGYILTDPSDPESAMGLRYEELIAPLIGAIKVLAARIEALEASGSRA